VTRLPHKVVHAREAAADGAPTQQKRRQPKDPKGALRQAQRRSRIKKEQVQLRTPVGREKLLASLRARKLVGDKVATSDLIGASEILFDELLDTDPKLSQRYIAKRGEPA